MWGQFSIFGAVEENLRCELGGIRGDEKFVEEMRLSRMQGGRSVRWKAAEEDAGTGEGRIVHRDCTGNAERLSSRCDWKPPTHPCEGEGSFDFVAASLLRSGHYADN